MAVDKSLLDAITGGYKFYLDDMKSKNITGQYYDEVERLFNRIEELGEECSDMNELYAKMQNENITVKMSDAYTRALTEEGNKNYMPQNGEVPDDSQMFKNTVDAMRNCIKALRDNFDNLLEKATESGRMRMMVENNPETLIKSIEDMIAVSEEPGMTYANFLRIQIERGLDKAADGIVTRDFIKSIIESKSAVMEPEIEIKVWEEKLDEYNKEASKNKFNTVDIHVWDLISDRIERKYRPEIIRHECIFEIFKQIVYDLNYWTLSYCFSFAPSEVAPWDFMPYEKAVEDMIKVEHIMPGIIYEREKLLFRYFGLRLKDIVKDAYYLNHIKSNAITDSQDIVEFLLLEVYPQCKPFCSLTQDLIDKRTSLHKEKKEFNPDMKEYYLRFKRFCNSKYGEEWMEKFLKEQGLSENLEYCSNSKHWTLEEFIMNIDSKMIVHDLDEVFVENSASSKVEEATNTLKEKAGGLFSFFKR